MTHLNKTDKKALWAKVLPALSQAWHAFELLHGVPASVWPEPEDALFNLNPRLYRGYVNGETPAMRRGAARNIVLDSVFAYYRVWGIDVLIADLQGPLRLKIQKEK